MPSSTLASVEPPSNVLVVANCRGTAPACTDPPSAGGPLAELRVTFADEEPPAGDPETNSAVMGIIAVGDVLRAAAADNTPDYTAPFVIDAVDDPTDLSALGVRISAFCEAWDGDYQIRVCFDSLDRLLRHAEHEQAFHFTYVLAKRLTDVGALAHFHFDPTGHDERTLSTFGTIFDDVIIDDGFDLEVPEATDKEVASMLSTIDNGTERSSEPPRVAEEATDDEIARLLGN